jgi:large subunit ribosomal protein L22
MEAVAKIKSCPMSARKMRLVADLIRGKNIDEALNILKFTKKEAATWAEKVLLSAIANWEYKTDMVENADDYDLYVSEIFADQGMALKRFRPAAYGRAHRIKKHTCHLTIKVKNRILLPQEQDGLEEAYEEEELLENEDVMEDEELVTEENDD